MTEPTDNVVTFPAKADDAEQVETFETHKATIDSLMATVEEMDRGMKLMVGVIAEQDVRLRALELAQRKADRRNIPAIVNQNGERVN